MFSRVFVLSCLPGTDLDLLCILQSDTAPFCESYAMLYFGAKHLEKRLNRGDEVFDILFFQKGAPFGQYCVLP